MAALATVQVPWREVLTELVVPKISWSTDFLTTLAAIAGTTISQYLFFWQASEEAEDIGVKPEREPPKLDETQASSAFARIRADTLVGMPLSNVIAIAIIITTAAALHAQGKTDIESSAQAAEALKPISGELAYLIFTIGIIGTGLLGIPVLAGSAAYALGEGRRWPVGLDRKPKEAMAFYASIAAATLIGIGLNFAPLNPIKALYWSAVINGVVAVPVVVLLMLMTARRAITGDFVIRGWLRALGWISTGAMAACVIGMIVTWLV